MAVRQTMSRFLPSPFVVFSALLALPLLAEPEPPEAPSPAGERAAEQAANGSPGVERAATIKIDGREIAYKASAGKIVLQSDSGTPRAAMFHVSYIRTGVDDPENRPVMFAFNGGPGSSSVWLHLGGLGPKIVTCPAAGTLPPPPPARVADNPLSILDVCDLVFIDPVATGYSRTEKDVKNAEFHGLQEDIESVGDFIRRWITDNGRWRSPKFLLGESYGGVRAAGLVNHMQSRFGMSFNGVVLLSAVLDFATLGGDLADVVFLPTYASVAHYHKKIGGDRDALVREATNFAQGDYATALLKGNTLPPAEKAALAKRLQDFTGIPAARWEERDLRLDPGFFRTELLRKEGKVLGRFDARVVRDSVSRAAHQPDADPSFDFIYGPFATALMDYLTVDLGYLEARPYEVMSSQMSGWRWNSENRIVSVADDLGRAMRVNPHLRVLVMAGHTDLATPPESVAHSLRHLGPLPAAVAANVRTAMFEAGHMFYLNPPDLEKARRELTGFVTGAGR